MRFQLSPPSSLRNTETGEPPASIRLGSVASTMNDQICTPLSGKLARLNVAPASVDAIHAIGGAGEHQLGIARVHEHGERLQVLEHVAPAIVADR